MTWFCAALCSLVQPCAGDGTDGSSTSRAIVINNEFNEAVVCLGDFPANERKSLVFKIENRTGGELELLKVDSSCGCAVGSATNRVTNVGGELELKVDVISKAGFFEKELSLNFGGKPKPLILKLTGEAKQRISISPTVLDYKSTQGADMELRLTTPFDDDLDFVDSCVSQMGVLKIEIRRRSSKELVLNSHVIDPADRFWKQLSVGNEVIRLKFRDGKELSVGCFVMPAVSETFFPKVLRIETGKAPHMVLFSKEEGRRRPSSLRIVRSGTVVASGTLELDKGSMQRYALTLDPKNPEKRFDGIVEVLREGNSWDIVGDVVVISE